MTDLIFTNYSALNHLASLDRINALLARSIATGREAIATLKEMREQSLQAERERRVLTKAMVEAVELVAAEATREAL